MLSTPDFIIDDPDFILVDLFCGAGGTSLGVESATIDNRKVAKVIAAINHDPVAIESHWANHPDVYHFEEDIRTVRMQEVLDIVNSYRAKYPRAKLILWASLECTHFSKAKGGKARKADSRTLAKALYMQYDPVTRKYRKGDSYIQILQPDYIHIENVVEFLTWGPLDRAGNPVKEKKGTHYRSWCKAIQRLGYVDEWRKLDSADFGAYTSRNRLFGCFAKKGLPIIWPEATHAKNGKGGKTKWKAVKEVLDFEDEGRSIFGRKKHLSGKTHDRILAGLYKYVAGGDRAFIQKHFSGKPKGKCISVEGPTGTITTSANQSIVQAQPFLLKYNSMSQSGKYVPPSIEDPCPVLTTGFGMNLVTPAFLAKYHGKGQNITSVDEPASTITTKDRIAKIQAEFMVQYQGNSDAVSVEQPAPTLLTKDKLAFVQTSWLDKQYSGSANHQSIEQPAGSILANDKHSKIQTVWIDRQYSNGTRNSSVEDPLGALPTVPKANLVKAEHFIMPTHFNNKPQSIEDPLQTITANRKWHYLVNPQWGNQSRGVEQPCFTLIAKMDKIPPYLVTTETGELAIEVFEDDPPGIVKIKEFMAAYGIGDVKMRMLKISELKPIQGLGNDYVLKGTQADQKKFIGNSVHPLVPKAWYEAKAIAIRELSKLQAA